MSKNYSVDSASHLGAPGALKEKPCTAVEWAFYWNHHKRILLPTTGGGYREVDIRYCVGRSEEYPAGRWFDAAVELPGDRRFFVLFTDEKTIEPATQPVLVIPGHDPARGWWVLPK